MSDIKLLLLCHVVATLMMAGVIWMVQLVHYPLFRFVGDATYTAYQTAHINAITLLVLPLMLVELVTGILLIIQPPASVPTWSVWVGMALIGLVWGVTALVNVPQHSALVGGFDAEIHAALVASNWLRTLGWTLRGGLVVWMLARVMG
ncbi:MAG: hypothetical protein SGI73_22390 [Chloroflexota bacterium]|nr:hypothetical protein [Chloroflexota bacterium]